MTVNWHMVGENTYGTGKMQIIFIPKTRTCNQENTNPKQESISHEAPAPAQILKLYCTPSSAELYKATAPFRTQDSLQLLWQLHKFTVPQH
jgi:hypothetical protein